MATFRSLVDSAVSVIDDPDWDDERVLDTMNQGLLEIAGGGVHLQDGSRLHVPPLPDLYTSATVATTVTAVADLPVAYQRGLFFVTDASKQPVEIVKSLQKLLVNYPALDEAGAVKYCTVKGKKLIYQPIPAATTNLTVHFYQLPTTVLYKNIETATPDGLPDHLQHPLLFNYAVAKAHDSFEDSVEGGRPNSQYYWRQFLIAVESLIAAIGPEDGLPELIQDTADFIGYFDD